MKNNILPNVLEIAERNHLEVDPKTLNKKEVRCKCPFCHADANNGKFHLSLNEDKNVFKCWYCKEGGGVLKFIALLEDKSEIELIEQVRKQNGSKYKRHPAERLTRSQLKAIGYPKIDWIANRKHDKELYEAYREKVWNDWLHYAKNQKQLSYQLLFVGLVSGTLKNSIEKVKQIELEIDEDFLDKMLEELFKESKEDNTFEMEKRALDLLGAIHPYETYLK